jgi:hypothetical protein
MQLFPHTAHSFVSSHTFFFNEDALFCDMCRFHGDEHSSRRRTTSGAGIAQWYSCRLRAGWSGVRVPVGSENFCLHHLVQTGSGAHPASYPMGNQGLLHFHLIQRSRMRGVIPPLPQYAFLAWCSVKVQGKIYLTSYHIAIRCHNTQYHDSISCFVWVWNSVSHPEGNKLRMCGNKMVRIVLDLRERNVEEIKWREAS